MDFKTAKKANFDNPLFTSRSKTFAWYDLLIMIINLKETPRAIWLSEIGWEYVVAESSWSVIFEPTDKKDLLSGKLGSFKIGDTEIPLYTEAFSKEEFKTMQKYGDVYLIGTQFNEHQPAQTVRLIID